MAHDEMSERLGCIDARLANIERAVMGNGQPGLAQRVGSLEAWRSMLIGAWLLLVAAVGLWARWR